MLTHYNPFQLMLTHSNRFQPILTNFNNECLPILTYSNRFQPIVTNFNQPVSFFGFQSIALDGFQAKPFPFVFKCFHCFHLSRSIAVLQIGFTGRRDVIEAVVREDGLADKVVQVVGPDVDVLDVAAHQLVGGLAVDLFDVLLQVAHAALAAVGPDQRLQRRRLHHHPVPGDARVALRLSDKELVLFLLPSSRFFHRHSTNSCRLR